MAKTDFCYVVSHGFAARMLLQTDLLLKLADEGKTVAVILPDAEDSKFQMLSEHENVTLYNADMKLSLFDDDYGFKRRYFLEDIQSNPVFVEKHLHSLFWSKSKHPWKRIRPLYYYLIYKLIPFFPGIRKRFLRNEEKYLKSARADYLIREIDPQVVVSTYPINYIEAKVLYAAGKKGVKKIIHLLSWDNITSKGIFPVKADHYVSWGPIMAAEFKEYYGVSDAELSICGVPHFDQHVNQEKNPQSVRNYGIDPEKPYVFFGMSSPRFAPYEIEIVEEMAGWGIPMIVRPHPQNVTGALADKRWIGRLEKLVRPGVAVSFPSLEQNGIRWSMRQEDMNELTDLIHFSSVVVNSGSTISIDGLVLKKPVIMTAFDGARKLSYWKSVRRLQDYTHLKKFIGLGGVEVVDDYTELREAIEKYFKDGNHNLDNRLAAVHEQCHKLDGRSTERAVVVMLKHV